MSFDPNLYSHVAKEEDYADRSVIIEEGSTGYWIYVILEGKVRVTQKTPQGAVTIDTLREGDIFGEMAFFERGESSRTASIIADGPVRLGLLDSDQLEKDYEALSSQLKELVTTLIVRLKETTRRASTLSAETSKKP
jgi:CRP/FNR family cyclic AMP-dependent transcriptional regulator